MYDDNKLQNANNLLPSKHDIISCLAVGGRWVTSKANLQVRISMRTGIEMHINNCQKLDVFVQ